MIDIAAGSTILNDKQDLDEVELDHLAGHKGSKPVRIGNGAADHLQLVYLSQSSAANCLRIFMAS